MTTTTTLALTTTAEDIDVETESVPESAALSPPRPQLSGTVLSSDAGAIQSLQIISLAIYNRDGKRRELHFRLGKVNIITGASLTGKSALIKIVDYCLGRNDFIIPVGPISETVSWYVIHLKLPSGEAVVGRPPPETGAQSTSAVFFQAGGNLQLPEFGDLQPNSNTDALSQHLTEAVGITANLNVPAEGQSREPLQASIKHARFLLFQPQGIIANEKHLFYRQDEERIPQAIMDTLPYFLGATGDDQYERLQQLRRLRRELRLLERRQADEEAVQGRDNSRALALVAEGENVGLFSPGSRNENLAEVVLRLRTLSQWTPMQDDSPEADTVTTLEAEREQLLEQIKDTQREIDAVRSFVAAQDGFSVEATDQKQRLTAINLYRSDPAGICPLCEHELNGAVPKAEAVLSSLTNLERHLAGTIRQRPRLETFITDRQTRLADLRRQLRETKAAIDAIMVQDEARQRDRNRSVEQAKVVGRISLFLESVRITQDDQVLRGQIEDMRLRVTALEEALSDEIVDDRLNSILQVIGRDMSQWAIRLELEHSEWPIGIDLNARNPTVVAHRGTGPVRMFQMGGGKNFMGYHVVTHLALQKLFRERSRPVPGLLMLDQPTQVFYPPEKVADRSLDDLGDEDQRAVSRLFKLIFEVTEQLTPNFQVIITDHADLNEPWFQDAVVARWRGGEKLVPEDWIEPNPPAVDGTTGAK